MKRLKQLLASAAIVSLSLLCGCSSPKKDELKVLSSKTYELGDSVSLAASEYLLSEPDDRILKEIEVQSDLKTDEAYSYNGFTDAVTDAGKEYLGLGSYTVTLVYNGVQYPVRVTVRDTVMPEFVSPAAVVTVPAGETDFDFSRVYRTSDKDTVTLRVDGDYDLNEEGTYPVTLVATDGSGNTNSLEITVNVVAKNKPITASDQFDDEYVPSEDDEDSSEESDDPDLPSEEDPNTPAPPTNPGPGACTISNAPSASEVYYNFSDLYAAGSAWNQMAPGNYFYYLEGVDDCGNKVYFLTKGSAPQNQPADPSDPQGNVQNTQPQSA